MSLTNIGIKNADGSGVTPEQRARVAAMAKRFHVVSAESVECSPEYGWIAFRAPHVEYETLVIQDDGVHALNNEQLDGFKCNMTWFDPSDEEDRFVQRVFAGKRKRIRVPSGRDSPYPLRERTRK